MPDPFPNGDDRTPEKFAVFLGTVITFLDPDTPEGFDILRAPNALLEPVTPEGFRTLPTP